MFERYLIDHCSPTLASLKIASLFTYHFKSLDELFENVSKWNRELEEKGIAVTVLQLKSNTALIYVYRKDELKNSLNKIEVSTFMKKCGYKSTTVSYALNMLRARLEKYNSFPHEIGVFLGYPLGDVIGFIKNQGRNCKCIGCWKVYGDECYALKTFRKYKKCKDIYSRLWMQGKSVSQLTVAV